MQASRILKQTLIPLIVYSMQSPLQSSLSIVAGSSSVASDYGSDTAYEPSDLGKPRIGWDDNSEVSTDR